MRKTFFEPASGHALCFETDEADRYNGKSFDGPWSFNRIDLFHTSDGRWIALESSIHPSIPLKNKWKTSISHPCYEITSDDAAEWFSKQGIDPPDYLLDELGQSTRRAEDAKLSENKRLILVAVLQLKAFDSDSSVSADVIANKALGVPSGGSIKKTLAELVSDDKLLCSVKGRSGGYWLTPDGRERAEKLTAQ